MKIELKKLHPNAVAPAYGTSESAAVDLRAMIDAPLTVEPGAVHLIPTGIAIHIGDPNCAATILPRSGLGHKHGLILGNGTGLIDADYQGELKVSCWNRSNEAYVIKPEERIAQLVIVPIIRAEFVEVEEFTPSERGAGGFGSTGKH